MGECVGNVGSERLPTDLRGREGERESGRGREGRKEGVCCSGAGRRQGRGRCCEEGTKDGRGGKIIGKMLIKVVVVVVIVVVVVVVIVVVVVVCKLIYIFSFFLK